MSGMNLPMLPLRGMTVFPHMVLHFDVGRGKSIAALEEAMVQNQMIFLATQRDARVNEPELDDIFEIGTISKIKQVLKLPGDTIRVLVEGICRARRIACIKTDPYYEVEVEEDVTEEEQDLETEALMRSVTEKFENYAHLSRKISGDALLSLTTVADAGQFSDIVAANILVKQQDKQDVLESFSVKQRLEKLYDILNREIGIVEIENKISSRVKRQIDKTQKEYYLREQVKAIQKELGEKDIMGDVQELKARAAQMPLSQEAAEKVEKELDRLSRMSQGTPEASVSRTYIDWILDLPWGKQTVDDLSLENARKILDEDHYGLQNVKERMIEYLAVRQLKKDMKGPVLCFVGPPGVGKTSLGHSIARALNREFIRVSLGGVRDEAEIRGHRRTYIGAIPGRIINSMKQCGTMNPVFMFDEIDKTSGDFKGDLSSAMLEVLDSEQNFAFQDHYLELNFDLSKVMFITTANTTDTIPRPLLDRMEVIELSSYTEEEKLGIAMEHLLDKQIREHGLKKRSIIINKDVMHRIIIEYTREAGVRNLERQIANICRKVACKVVEGQKSVRISENNLDRYLGIPRFRRDIVETKDEVGVVTGLAWTPVGGVTLSIEVMHMKGSGKLELTGQLGGIMQESARAAYSYIRAHHAELGIDEKLFTESDVHIHIPEGATPKDGPSAGITLATAMASALSGVPARGDVAMTGEITLRGRVLPIGGLKEKILAAHRANIRTVILPKENAKDLTEIPENIKNEIKCVLVDNVSQVFERVLLKEGKHD
ncbi:MAG: endopeptidase La [Christensenellales bacterium]